MTTMAQGPSLMLRISTVTGVISAFIVLNAPPASAEKLTLVCTFEDGDGNVGREQIKFSSIPSVLKLICALLKQWGPMIRSTCTRMMQHSRTASIWSQMDQRSACYPLRLRNRHKFRRDHGCWTGRLPMAQDRFATDAASDRAASFRLHRTVPAVEVGPDRLPARCGFTKSSTTAIGWDGAPWPVASRCLRIKLYVDENFPWRRDQASQVRRYLSRTVLTEAGRHREAVVAAD